METIIYKAVYQRARPYGSFRAFSECEFEFQKNGRNELEIGNFDGRDILMRVPGMDFQKCEIIACFLACSGSGVFEKNEPDLQIFVRFPDQQTMVNDYLYAAVSAYLYHRGIRYENMERHLSKCSPDKFGLRFRQSNSENGFISYSPQDLFRFSLEAEPRDGGKGGENREDLP